MPTGYLPAGIFLLIKNNTLRQCVGAGVIAYSILRSYVFLRCFVSSSVIATTQFYCLNFYRALFSSPVKCVHWSLPSFSFNSVGKVFQHNFTSYFFPLSYRSVFPYLTEAVCKPMINLVPLSRLRSLHIAYLMY